MSLLPPGRDRRLYLGLTLVDALGSGVFTPVSVLYLTQVVGLSPARVGLGLALTGSLGFLVTPAAGAIVDRYDARLVVTFGFAVTAVGFVFYTGVRSFGAFLVVGSLITVFDGIGRSGRRIVAFAVAEGQARVQLVAYERAVRNAGYALGGVLAGVAVAGGTHAAYVAVLLANAASFAFAAVAVLVLPKARPHPREGASTGGYRVVLRDRTYVGLAAATCVLWLNDSVLKVGLAIWLVTRTSAPHWLVGAVFTLNTVLVVVLQVRASRGSETADGASRAFRLAAFALVVSCALFAAAAGVTAWLAVVALLAGGVALTVGELFNSAAEWGASLSLAREELRGRYLAVFATGRSLQQAVGPAIVTMLLVHGGRGGWAALAVILLAAGLGAARMSRHAAFESV